MVRTMSDHRLVALSLLGLSVTSCGGGNAGPGSGGGAASCVPGKLTLVGDLESQPVDAEIDYASAIFQQGGGSKSYDLGYVDGMLHLEWTALIAYGQSTAAKGTVVMPTGQPHAGQTICAGSGSIKYVAVGDGGFANNNIFTLRSLSSGPVCPGAPLAGSIDGCGADSLQ